MKLKQLFCCCYCCKKRSTKQVIKNQQNPLHASRWEVKCKHWAHQLWLVHMQERTIYLSLKLSDCLWCVLLQRLTTTKQEKSNHCVREGALHVWIEGGWCGGGVRREGGGSSRFLCSGQKNPLHVAIDISTPVNSSSTKIKLIVYIFLNGWVFSNEVYHEINISLLV